MALLPESEVALLASRWRLPLVAQRIVVTDAELERAAVELGYPVVLKAVAPDLTHRTDLGGVILDVRDADLLALGAGRLRERIPTLSGFLIQERVAPGPELHIGFLRDPAFGAVLLLGRGGEGVEVDPDLSSELLELDEGPRRPEGDRARAGRMLSGLRGAARYQGHRGAPAVDLGQLGELLGAIARMGLEEPEIQAIDMNPVILGPWGLRAVDLKVHKGTPIRGVRREDDLDLEARARSVATFFEARSVAVVGASRKPDKAGNVILRNLLRLGFRGEIRPIHPEHAEVLGLPCVSSLRLLPAPVDLAVAVVPREAVPGVLEDCGAVGTRHLVISTAGFSDAGGEGRTLERALLERARELGVRIMGPNSIGTVEVGSGLCTSLASIEPVPPGAASFLGQSGLFASCFPRWLSATGRQGARRLAALGNKGDVDEADILACFALDEGTRAVGLYLEGITDGLRLARSLRDIGRRKPLVVLRAGRTAPGARAAASHTGALANDDRVAEAAMRQAGAVPVASFRELFDQVKLFEQLDRPVGGALGVVSITGVGCVLAADEAARAGLTLPELSAKTIEGMREFVPRWAPLRNPVDMWSTIEAVGPTEAWRTLSRLVLLDRAVETLLLVFIAIPEAEIDVATVFGGLRALAPAKCVVGSIVGEEPAADRLRVSLEALGIPCLGEPVEAISCLGRAHAYWGWRERQRA